MKSLTETPYDGDVRDLARVKCVSLDRARDLFIYIALPGHNPPKAPPKLITYRPAEPGKGLSTYSGSPDGCPSEGEDA